MIKLVHVVGARPNFMKVAPLLDALAEHATYFENHLVHTGQHYDAKMSEQFFTDLKLPRPDHNLGVGGGSHAEQTAAIMVKFEKVVRELQPDLVVVVGDVNSTLACSLVAAKEHVPLAHIEAGLRSRDRTMPEEINRLVTDVLSNYHFTTCREADANLVAEGIWPDHIYFVGNLMVDSLLKHRERARELPLLGQFSLKRGEYGLVTLHRPSNVDDREALMEVLSGLERVSAKIPLLFPVHPRTIRQLESFGWLARIQANPEIVLAEPLGYLEFLHCMMHAKLVITDSGGIQEETTILNVPCMTLRPNTERAITIECGTNELVRPTGEALLAAVERVLHGRWPRGRVPELWDGRSGPRVAEILRRIL